MKSKKPTQKKVTTKHVSPKGYQSSKRLIPMVGIFLGATVLFAVVYLYSLQTSPVKAVADVNGAVVAVRTSPAVKTQIDALRKAGVNVVYNSTVREDGNWNVQMSESRSDHNVTINWFVVNSDTGNIICSMFDLKTSKLNKSCQL
jgi:hypothetical protein